MTMMHNKRALYWVFIQVCRASFSEEHFPQASSPIARGPATRDEKPRPLAAEWETMRRAAQRDLLGVDWRRCGSDALSESTITPILHTEYIGASRLPVLAHARSRSAESGQALDLPLVVEPNQRRWAILANAAHQTTQEPMTRTGEGPAYVLSLLEVDLMERRSLGRAIA